jgi:hypothetical protein
VSVEAGALVAVNGEPGVWRVVCVDAKGVWCCSYATGALAAFSPAELCDVAPGTCTDRTVILS